MRFNEWFELNKARAPELAQSFPVTTPAVHQWFHNGVPLERMQGVEDFTAGAVTVAEMVAESAERRQSRRGAEVAQ